MSGLLQREDFESRVRANLGRAVFTLRWIMVPFYIGLIGALLMLAVKLVQKLLAAVPALLGEFVSDTIFTVLSLVDISLVANLVVIVMFAGWENFIGRLLGTNSRSGLAWLGQMNLGDVKLRLIGSIMVIGAISLLESSVHVDSTPKDNILWQLAILLGIGVTGLLLAVMDHLAEKGEAGRDAPTKGDRA
jgi:uncharacterized protein (TIGR00645 family)